MAIITSHLYMLIFFTLYLMITIIMYLNHKSGIYIFLVLLPVLSLYLLCTYYLLPLPLNSEGFYALYHPKTSINIIPFLSSISCIKASSLRTYFATILPLISAAVLAGCGIPFLFKKKRTVVTMFLGFFLFLIFLIVQIIVRLATGYEGKPIDVTDSCLYLIFQFIGLLLYGFVDKKYPEFHNQVHANRTGNTEDSD